MEAYIDLQGNTFDEIIEAEKRYLSEVYNRPLSSSEETPPPTPKYYKGKRMCSPYRYFAMLLWPKEFEVNHRVIVHHINFDRSDNRACNLVVLSYSQHDEIHKLFDKNYEVRRKHMRESKQDITGDKNPMFGKKHSESTKEKQSNKRKEWFTNPENLRMFKESQRGKKGSVIGRRAITNGIENRFIVPTLSEEMMKQGWRYGSTQVKKK